HCAGAGCWAGSRAAALCKFQGNCLDRSGSDSEAAAKQEKGLGRIRGRRRRGCLVGYRGGGRCSTERSCPGFSGHSFRVKEIVWKLVGYRGTYTECCRRKTTSCTVFQRTQSVGYIIETVPRFTEETIKRLCKEAVTVRSAEDLHRVIADLRLAL